MGPTPSSLHMETCNFDPKEDKFLAQKQGCIFKKSKYVDLALFCPKKAKNQGGEFFSLLFRSYAIQLCGQLCGDQIALQVTL